MSNLLNAGGRSHALARLEVVEVPTLQLPTERGEVWIVRSVVRPRNNCMVQIRLEESGVCLALHPEVELVLNLLYERLRPSFGLPFLIQRSQVLVYNM